jgi:hypothetical protein
MNAVDPTYELEEVKHIQQALNKNPKDLDALLKLASKVKKLDLKRKVLNRILTLDPVNKPAREMLLEMDRAEMNGGYAQPIPTSISTVQNSTSTTIGSSKEPSKKLLVLRYPFFPLQLFVLGLMAITFAFCLAAIRDPEVLAVFGIFFLFLIIPLWFISAVVEVSRSGIRVCRLFGIFKQEVTWADIISMRSNTMGIGIKLSTKESKSVRISSQLRGYPTLVEILQKLRPDLFSITNDKGTKTFQKTFFSKYGYLTPLILFFLIFIGSVSAAQIFPALISVTALFFLWKRILSAPYRVKLEGNSLQTRSFLKQQQLTAQQIKSIHMITLRTIRGVAETFVQIESLDGTMFRLSRFPEGNEIMYGFLRNWWSANRNQ